MPQRLPWKLTGKEAKLPMMYDYPMELCSTVGNDKIDQLELGKDISEWVSLLKMGSCL